MIFHLHVKRWERFFSHTRERNFMNQCGCLFFEFYNTSNHFLDVPTTVLKKRLFTCSIFPAVRFEPRTV